MTEGPRYRCEALVDFARALFAATGIEREKADAMATYLVEADLMGHTTHGLALAGWYLESIESGGMTKSGEPEVQSDRGAAICWDGRRLPGAWLTAKGVAFAAERAQAHGTAVLVIGNSHHIGCLAAYLPIATGQGLLVSITSSSPSGAQVAPFGGLKGLYTPDPVAHGIPTPGDPILIDISASITTVNMAKRLQREGQVYDQHWLMDAQGNPSRDPAVLDTGGTLLPVGGLDHGQKGYGMALYAEALTQGLAGKGRVDGLAGTNAAIVINVYDPAAFGGREAFLRQTGWLADACRATPPRPGVERVRLPGEAALARRRYALENGVQLHAGIMDGLTPFARKFNIGLPEAVQVLGEEDQCPVSA